MKEEWLEALRRESRFACRLVRDASVLVELPEGLRGLEAEIEHILRSCGARIVEFRLEPVYGACDTVACEASYDVVLHVGHAPYVYRPIYRCGGTRVAYLPLVLEASRAEAEKLASSLEGYESIGIGYVVNYSRLAALLVSELRRRGVSVHATHLLGCYTGGLEGLEVDAYLVVGSRFHALGLGLAVHAERRILLYEPGRGLYDYTREAARVLSKRYWVASRARDARSWGVIQGSRGQCRPVLGLIVSKLLEGSGRRVRVYRVSRLARSDLDAITDVEAFVVLACPRLAVEDLDGYPRPVLVPGEVPYALGLAERVRFPW